MVKVRENSEFVYVTSPFNIDFVSKVKQIGGRWSSDSREWIVEQDNKDLLIPILVEVYGINPFGDLGKITVKFKAVDFEVDSVVRIGYIEAVKRPGRDRMVLMMNNAAVLEGEFPRSGGSMKTPRPEADEEIVIKMDIPQQVYENLSDDDRQKLTVIGSEDDRISELKTRKEILLAELEAIEKQLSELGE